MMYHVSTKRSSRAVVVRRIIGAVIVLTSLAGLGVGLYAAYQMQETAGQVETEVVSGLDFGLDALQVVSDTLDILVRTVYDTSTVVDEARAGAASTADGLENVRPAVQELADITASQLPDSIEAIRSAMPALEDASAAIDKTLRTLSSFQWSTTIPLVNYEVGFGLGIDYDPAIPLDQSVAEVNAGLDSIPTRLTDIQEDLLRTDQSLGDSASSLEQLGESLTAVSQDLASASIVLQEYRGLVARATRQVRAVRWNIRQQIQTGRLVLTGVLAWLALSQLGPLYLGCRLLTYPRGRLRYTIEPPSTYAGDHSEESDQGEQDLPAAEGYSDAPAGQ